MSQPSASRSNPDPTPAMREPASSKRAGHVCPFCGTVREERATPCPRCTMEDTTATRQATRARIGPWYVLQQRNPSAPGMRFDMLLTLVKRGQVTARSIVRGPTTHQLWRFAARVRGLSREFGLCYSCGSKVESAEAMCEQCHKMQEPPMNPDVLLESKLPAKSIPAVRREIPSATLPASAHDAATDLVLPTLGSSTLGATVASAPPAAPIVPVSPPVARQTPRPPTAPTERKVVERPSKPVAPPVSPTRTEQGKSSGDDQKGRLMPSIRPTPGGPADASDASVDGGARPILSAKELAAAFRLDFIPQPGQTDSAAAATKKRRRLPWTLAALVLLGGGATAVYLTPTLRSQAATWGNQTYQRLHDKWASFQNGRHGLPDANKPAEAAAKQSPQQAIPPVNPSRSPDESARKNAVNGVQASGGVDPMQPAGMTDAPMTLRHLPVPGVDQKGAPLPGAEDDRMTTKSPATGAESHETPAPPAAKAGPWDQLKNTVAPSDAPAEPAPHGAPSTDATTPPPAGKVDEATPVDMSGDYSEKIRELWIAAIDAEGRNNYPKAVKLYEQIQQYPRDQWPVSLELRLEQVKRQIQENSK